MEIASSPSPDNPARLGEFIRQEWWQRLFNVKTRFDIVGAFREKEEVKWAYRQFWKRNLLPLLKPAGDFFYPPFVCVFYQNLTYDTENPAYLSSIVLGQQVYVSVLERLAARLMTRAVNLVSTLHTVICISLFVTCLEGLMAIVNALV
jgi:hypothetical protein